MPQSTPPVQATSATPAAAGGARPSGEQGQDIAGLFALIAGRMQAHMAGPQADGAPENELPMAETSLTPSLESGDLEGETVSELPVTDPDLSEETDLAPGITQALNVLTQIQEGRITLPSEGAARRADPLATAIQALSQAAGQGNNGSAMTANPARKPPAATAQTHPEAATPASQSSLNGLLTALNASQSNPAIAAKIERVQVSELGNASGTQNNPSASMLNPATAGRGETLQPSPRFDIPGNIQQPAWQQALSERVVMLSQQDFKQAELTVHPEDLGPVKVRIETTRDQAAVQFSALHGDTRDALEAALPRLREYFSQQGMTLVRADVQQNFAGQQQQQPDGSGASLFQPEAAAQTSDHAQPASASAVQRVRGDGLLDIYA